LQDVGFLGSVVRRTLVFLLVFTAALVVATPADAAIFIRVTTTTVQRGGVLHVVGNAAHMPLYALPAARMPCARHGTCPGIPIHRDSPPKRKPFVFLGYTPGSFSGFMRAHAFAIRLSRAVRPGRYKVFVWCAACGGSLIMAGNDPSGQTLRVLR
jgi:hypothetical protein